MNESVRRQRRVKIAATLGPASSTREIIKELFLAGADVFRLNLSHGTHADIKKRFDFIRDIESELDRPICVMADLQGPKLRCGAFEGSVANLEEGHIFCFDFSLGCQNVPQACRDPPRRFPTLPDPENRPTKKCFNCCRQCCFATFLTSY